MSRVDDLQQAFLKDPAYRHEFAGLALRAAPSGRPSAAKRVKSAHRSASRLAETRPA